MFSSLSLLIQIRAEDLGWLPPRLPEERGEIMVPEFLNEEKKKKLKRGKKEKPKERQSPEIIRGLSFVDNRAGAVFSISYTRGT